jgi:predicted NBD/HSP70 family sugar kinase
MKEARPAVLNAPRRAGDWNGTGPRLTRAISEARVMDVLHRGPVSRAAISRQTGLSKPTVSAVIRDLEEVGLVRTRGLVEGQVGRASTLYEVNPAAAYALGVDVDGFHVRATITDLFGDARAELEEPTSLDNPDQLLAQIRGLHRALLRKAGIERAQVRAAGLSVPGIVDTELDRITAAYNVPALMRMHPHRDVRDVLQLPVVIGNDANLAAAAEQWRGSATGLRDFVALWIGFGVGLGIVAGGSVLSGAHGAAGEIGQLPLGLGPIDRSRSIRGPLEDTASGPSLLDQLRAALARGGRSSLGPDASIGDLFDAADSGDGVAGEVVAGEAEMIAFAIAAIVAVLNPGLVVLGGSVGANGGLLEPVRRRVAELVLQPPRIETSALGDRATLLGAVAVAIDRAREQLLGEVRRTVGGNWDMSPASQSDGPAKQEETAS